MRARGALRFVWVAQAEGGDLGCEEVGWVGGEGERGGAVDEGWVGVEGRRREGDRLTLAVVVREGANAAKGDRVVVLCCCFFRPCFEFGSSPFKLVVVVSEDAVRSVGGVREAVDGLVDGGGRDKVRVKLVVGFSRTRSARSRQRKESGRTSRDDDDARLVDAEDNGRELGERLRRKMLNHLRGSQLQFSRRTRNKLTSVATIASTPSSASLNTSSAPS